MSQQTPSYVVAIDGSENSQRAEDFAIGLAKQTGASLVFATIHDWPSFQPVSALEMTDRPPNKTEVEQSAKEIVLDPALEKAKKAGVKVEAFFGWGHPANTLHAEAEKCGAGMIIIGRSGHGVVAELVLGSVSNALLHLTKLPVTLVP